MRAFAKYDAVVEAWLNDPKRSMVKAAKRFGIDKDTLRRELIRRELYVKLPSNGGGNKRLKGPILTTAELAEINYCPRCQNMYVMRECEWCKYLYKADMAVITRAKDRRKKRSRPRRGQRRNWMHNPNPWGD